MGKLVKSVEKASYEKFLKDLDMAMASGFMDPFDYLMKYEGYSMDEISKYSLNHSAESIFGTHALVPKPRDLIIDALAHSLLDGETDVRVNLENLEDERDDMSDSW